MCGDLENLELGDTVEYTLSKGKGNKVSAEKVTKVAPGMRGFISIIQTDMTVLTGVPTNKMCKIHSFPLQVNGIGDDVGATVMMGKVIRPLRSVDPSQTEYQGLIEVTEEGWCKAIEELVDLTFKSPCFL